MSYHKHQSDARSLTANAAIITLSDTRTPETDGSGQAIQRLLMAEGHVVTDYQVIPDEPSELRIRLKELLARADVEVILTNGGTGISRRDQTIDVVSERIDIPLPGFGELFRMLSWEQIGSGAMMSRAIGGIASGKPLFAMPGSTKAVELAMTRLILPELRHLLRELHRQA